MRSIYDLKQSSRQWYFRFHNAVISNNFVMIDEDHCVYSKCSGSKFVIMTLYVDDILIAENNVEYLKDIKR